MSQSPSPVERWDPAQDADEEAAEQLAAQRSGHVVAPGRKAVYWAVAAVALAIFVAVAWWLTWDPVHTQVIGFDTVDSTQTTMTFEVTKDPESTVVCQVSALSQSFAVVGVQSVTVAPTQTRTSTVTVIIPTQEMATTARVDSCK